MKTHLLFTALLISTLAFGQAKRPGKITKNQTSQTKLSTTPKKQAAGYVKLDGIDGESDDSSKSKRRKITNKPSNSRAIYVKLGDIKGESVDKASPKIMEQKPGNSSQRFYKKRKYSEEQLVKRKKRQ